MDVFWFYNQRKKIIVDFISEAEFLTYLVTGQRWPGHSDRANYQSRDDTATLGLGWHTG